MIPLISALATYAFFSLQPRTYQAVTTLLIRGPALSQEGGLPLSTDETLSSYAFLITQEPVLSAVNDKLHLGYSTDQLAQQVTVQLRTGTSLLDVYVVDSDPNRAAAIDNAIDDAFITQVSARLAAESAKQEAAYQTQIDSLQSEIDRLTTEIAAISVKNPSPADATKVASNQIQLDSDRSAQTALRTTLLGLRASDVLKGDEILVVRNAAAGIPSAVASRTDLLAALVGGLILATAAILSLYLLDTRVTSTQQLAGASGLPTLAAIKAARKRSRRQPAVGPELVVFNGAHPPAAADYNRLRRSLLQAMPAGECRVVIVTSAVRGEGKSSVAANLAALLAGYGHRSVLVDANLEGPTLSAIFSPNGDLAHRNDVGAPLAHAGHLLWQTQLSNLLLMDAGPWANGATAPSERLPRVLGADYLIVDAPSLDESDDAADLSARADGIILVVAAGRTSEEMVREGIDTLQVAGGKVIGTVLTGVEPSHEAFRYK